MGVEAAAAVLEVVPDDVRGLARARDLLGGGVGVGLGVGVGVRVGVRVGFGVRTAVRARAKAYG